MRDARPDQSGLYAIALAGLLAFLVGCSPEPPQSGGDPDQLRIVSFMPSATRIVVDLGLADRIVGVAEHDAAAPTVNADGNPMPIVGHFMDVDAEKLIALRPTHVIFPVTREAEPAMMSTLVKRTAATLIAEPYPDNYATAMLATARLGRALGRASAAYQLEARLRRETSRTSDAALVLRRAAERRGDVPGVLLAFTIDPVVASGTGSVNDELLAFAGADNALGDTAASAVTLDREALIDIDPDVVVLLLPGANDAEAAEKAAWFNGLPIAAVRSGRVHTLTDPQVLLPATNLPEVLAQLVALIWGETRLGADPAAASQPRAFGVGD
ncbi:MAG: ABC transporter substrate-binding protein [Planctomycetota bacterium]